MGEEWRRDMSAVILSVSVLLTIIGIVVAALTMYQTRKKYYNDYIMRDRRHKK